MWFHSRGGVSRSAGPLSRPATGLPRSPPTRQAQTGLWAPPGRLVSPTGRACENADRVSGPCSIGVRMFRTADTRIVGYEPLLAPAALLDELPLGDKAAATVERTRAEVKAVLAG